MTPPFINDPTHPFIILLLDMTPLFILNLRLLQYWGKRFRAKLTHSEPKHCLGQTVFSRFFSLRNNYVARLVPSLYNSLEMLDLFTLGFSVQNFNEVAKM